MSPSVWPVVEQRRDDAAGGVDGAVAVTPFAEWRKALTDDLGRQSLTMPEDNARKPASGEPKAVFATRVVWQQAHPGADLRGGGMHRGSPRIAAREVLEEPRSYLSRAIRLDRAQPSDETARQRTPGLQRRRTHASKLPTHS